MASFLHFLAAMTAQAAASPVAGGTAMPGREADARVAQITDTLTTAARARCPAVESAAGLLLQHLSQFELSDRTSMAGAMALDRGPGVVAVVPGGPAALAGVRAGDVLLAVNGTAMPPEPDLDLPFDARRAHARVDVVSDLLATSSASPTLDILRDGSRLTLTLRPRLACVARVRLARSGQRNAFADGRHVFLTTGLLASLRNDDELAFVIAHELAHNQLGHPALIRGGDGHHGMGRGGGRDRQLVRETEGAADAMAGEMMIDAGFDPVAGAQLLGRLAVGGLRIALFADHASDKARVEAMRRLSATRARQ